ncbi:MAG: hypothetical protein WA324_03495 [Bryobacteraceae bacterium]
MITLTLVAIATGIALLLVFRRFSNQRAVALAKRQIWAQLYALRLYSDELSVIWQVQGRLLAWNARYLFHMLRPVAVSIVPLSALLFMLDGFYGYRPLRSGESALVSVRSNTEMPKLTANGVSIETPALRIPTAHTIYWRVRAGTSSGHLIFGSARKPVYVGSRFAYISPCPSCFGNVIDVRYPPAYHGVFGYRVPWLAWFLLVSALTMFILRKRFGVTF